MIGKALAIRHRSRRRQQGRPVEKQQSGLIPLGPLAPGFERRAAINACGDALVVKAVERLLVGRQIAAGANFQFLQFRQQLPVVLEEGSLAVKLALDQGMTDENLARQHRIERPVVDPSAGNHGQAVQRDPLGGGHLGGAFLPMRLGMAALEQRPSQAFHPFRLDARHGAGEQPAGFDHLRRHHPARPLFEQPGTGEQVKIATPRTEVGMVLLLQTQMTEQAGQQGSVQAVIGRRLAVEPHPHFGDPPQQFLVQIVPFPHPHEGQEIGLTAVA